MKKANGRAMRCLSERDLEVNQKQTTYRRERERPFFSTPSFDWFLIGFGIMLLSAWMGRLRFEWIEKTLANEWGGNLSK